MSEQLSLDVAPPPLERRYTCCGQPCGELPPPIADPDYARRARELRAEGHPHAEDCTNPDLGTWIDRATGWPLRRLHCIAADGTCPSGGAFPPRPGLADPYGGRCCLELRAGAAAK